MELPALRAFMGALGVHNVYYASGEWAQCSCPLAPFRHRAGVDHNPSFGVSLTEPVYNCFVCGAGNLAHLLNEIDLRVSQNPDYKERYDTAAARLILRAEVEAVMPLPAYAEFVPSPYDEFQEWPEYVLEDFPLWAKIPKLAEYLERRHITPETAMVFDLRYDYTKDMCVAPFRNAAGKLSGMRGRSLEGKSHFDYTWNKVNNIGLVWYNEDALNLPGPLVVVEGQFDAMRLWPHYPKVVAILSATASAYKKKKLVSADCPVAMLLDNDHTGILQSVEWLKWMTEHGVDSFMVEYAEGLSFKDPGDAPDEWLAEVAAQLKTI